MYYREISQIDSLATSHMLATTCIQIIQVVGSVSGSEEMGKLYFVLVGTLIIANNLCCFGGNTNYCKTLSGDSTLCVTRNGNKLNNTWKMTRLLCSCHMNHMSRSIHILSYNSTTRPTRDRPGHPRDRLDALRGLCDVYSAGHAALYGHGGRSAGRPWGSWGGIMRKRSGGGLVGPYAGLLWAGMKMQSSKETRRTPDPKRNALLCRSPKRHIVNRGSTAPTKMNFESFGAVVATYSLGIWGGLQVPRALFCAFA